MLETEVSYEIKYPQGQEILSAPDVLNFHPKFEYEEK